MSIRRSKVPRISGDTSGADRHRVGINLVGELGLRTNGEDGGGHEGDGALDGRHIDQLTVEVEGRYSCAVYYGRKT